MSPPASAAATGGAPGCRATNGTKCDHSPRPRPNASSTIAASAPSFKHRERFEHATAQHAAANVDCGRRRDRAEGDDLQSNRTERHEIGDVGREPGREGGRDAGVHHEQALPAVEKRQPASVRLAKVDVAAARFRVARGQLAVGERPRERHAAHEEPRSEEPGGRRQRPCHRRRRQEDADGNDLPGDRGGRGRQAQASVHQNVTRAASWKARGPPLPNTPPAVVTAWPNALDLRYPGED